MRIHTWRNIFFFEGLFTVLVGIGAPFLMPRNPQECWFLNERERMIATHRLKSKSGADENEKVEAHHVKRGLTNINNYFCAFGFFFINITVQGISLFMVSCARLFPRAMLIRISLRFWSISDGAARRLSYTPFRLTSALVSSRL